MAGIIQDYLSITSENSDTGHSFDAIESVETPLGFSQWQMSLRNLAMDQQRRIYDAALLLNRQLEQAQDSLQPTILRNAGLQVAQLPNYGVLADDYLGEQESRIAVNFAYGRANLTLESYPSFEINPNNVEIFISTLNRAADTVDSARRHSTNEQHTAERLAEIEVLARTTIREGIEAINRSNTEAPILPRDLPTNATSAAIRGRTS